MGIPSLNSAILYIVSYCFFIVVMSNIVKTSCKYIKYILLRATKEVDFLIRFAV